MNYDTLITILISALSVIIILNFIMFGWVISLFLILKMLANRIEDAIDHWKGKTP